jgi:RNA recognition motif-containing protein
VTQVDVKQFALDKDVAEQQQESLKRKVYVKGLPPNCDKTKLREVFSCFGEVDKAFILYNHKNGSTRGFGFVEFVAQAAALQAVGKVVEICGKEIQISMAIQRHKGVPPAHPRKKPPQTPSTCPAPSPAPSPAELPQETLWSLLRHYQEARKARRRRRKSYRRKESPSSLLQTLRPRTS